MSSIARPAQDRFADILEAVRRHFVALLRAIQVGSYFDAWLSATLFRSALDAAADLACELPTESRWRSGYILDAMRCVATPVLALAPSPDRDEVRTLQTSDPNADQRAWKFLEERWRRAIRCSCVGDDRADLMRSN
jgi:hypothetical protein